MGWLKRLLGYRFYEIKVVWDKGKHERIVIVSARSEVSAVIKADSRYLGSDKGVMQILSVN